MARFSSANHPECEGEIERMIEGIVVGDSEKSIPEDTVELCHLSSCTPVEESCDEYFPSQEASGALSRLAWCVLSSLSVSQTSLLCSQSLRAHLHVLGMLRFMFWT